MSHVTVLADDRTGALETAGAIAEAGFRTVMVPFGASVPGGAECVVIDLASRHLSPIEAARRAVEAAALADGPLLHKIDSTLRGNWAAEAATFERPLHVVASFPRAGRACRDGVVYDHGVPVAEGPAGRDPRRPVTSSRPAEHLAAAGAAGFLVHDAETDADVDAAVRRWATEPGAVLSGTAAALGAAVRALRPGGVPVPRPVLEFPALVVCGSLHPVARRQLDVLRGAGWGSGDRLLLATRPERDDALAGGTAAEQLGIEARTVLEGARIETLVLIGGDTAHAVLGDVAFEVGGLLAPGVPWCRAATGGPLVVTKPGGFGVDDAILRLFA